MSLSYRPLAMAASSLCLTLALLWIVAPQGLLWVWHIDASSAALLMARRGGALFLGLAVMLWRTRDAIASPDRDAMAVGLSVSCAVLGALGGAEFVAGHVGAGIWLAVAVELPLAACFWAVRNASDVGSFRNLDEASVEQLAVGSQARIHSSQIQRPDGEYVVDLAEMDVVLMRQDPPFEMAYITATHLLEHIYPKTLVVNNPAAVRNAPDKLLVTHFPNLMPPTLIAWDRVAIRDFRELHGDIIVKPLFGNGGVGVFRIKPDEENLGSLLDMFFTASREPLMVQRYVPAVRLGDKRIILIDGEPLGALRAKACNA